MAGRETPATRLARQAGVILTVHEYARGDDGGGAVGAGYGVEAAAALGVDAGRVLKTLVVDLAGTLAVGVVPVAGQLDLKAVAAALGAKHAQLADPGAAERVTGYVRGGISPLGQRRKLATVIDSSALEHSTVFVSAGRRGLEIEIAPQDLVRLTGAVMAAVGRR